MPLQLDIVTAEQVIYSEEGVDQVVAPGSDGEFTVLPQHAEFITTLQPGELRITKGGSEDAMAITGGFLEVRDDRIVVLADAAERIDEPVVGIRQGRRRILHSPEQRFENHLTAALYPSPIRPRPIRMIAAGG